MTTLPNWTKKTASKIVGIQFSVLSPEEIRKCSVAEITSRDTYSNNVPVIGGMFDPRLGVLEPGLKCPTDGLDYIKTPGYFGHIELAKPVFYYQYLPTIIKLLKCVCVKCSKLLISKESNKECMDMKPDERWNHVHHLASKVKRCGDDTQDGCGCLVPKKIKKENLATLFAEWDGEAEEGSGGSKEKLNMKMTPEVVLKIFRRISDQDVAFMGFSPQFSRPDWFICQVLAIPPPAVRPSIKMDGNQRSEDDISHTIVNIIKANKTLLEKMNEPSVNSAIIDDWQSLLQYFIATQVDNNIPSCAPVAQRSGRPLKSIKERLNGKGGRVRGNLMGKRVDFSARSVITPDPNLSIRELGVPKKIAMNITKPVVVNNRNRDFLQQLVLNGPDVYPGANILEKKTGGDISLRYMDRSTVVLENGDVVHRHMMDGDGILFNRQPTLHRMSMMCHIARIMQQGDTFRMNIGDTKPYNADFDGDEMNLHMPQDDEAEAELKGLAAVPYQIISPAKNNSIIGIFQDSLLGIYQFTRSGIGAFDARAAMNILMGYKNVDASLFSDPTKKITNFEILSQILPPLSMKYKTKQFGGSDDYATSNNVLEIRDGEILRGHIDSGVLASSTNGMIQRICNDFGNMASANFIDDLQNIITEYMKTSAYSVGISDLISDKKTTEKIIDSIKTKKLEVKTIIDNIHIGTFENKSGRTNEEEFELLVTNILNKANGEAGDIGLKSLSKTNRFITMVNAGSKGSKVNIAQMICLVGQQTIDGKRVPYGFDSRTLPHYSKYDDGPAARGFVENSFIAGLTPSEVFFHAMGGRVGLIDTAVKSVTWETPIIIVENDVPKYVKIGEWIDDHLNGNDASRIQHMEEQNMEYLELIHPVKIVTMDYEGRVSWENITAVTRHDPGEKLFKITTKAGRYVTVTANKSLLVWNSNLNQFREEYTEDVKVGDFVPVAKNINELQTSIPIQENEIQLDKYFPRSEYVYGSEIHKAIILMKEAMKNRKKIPENWWNENNDNNFTLPFVSKARFQRAIVRSKLESISHNGIYTSNGTRQHSIIPETFSLSYDNGVFIGLFIAEGNINNSKIYITNNDETIRAFVKGWFSKYNIAFTETIKKNKIGGTTTTICGSSCILSKLITMMVGHGAKNKHVPNEAYISNIDFVKGILSGYISGDGYISKNSINSSSCCRRLSEDISLLCSRLEVHAKLSVSQLKKNNLGTKNIQPSYRVSIRAVNGRQFAEQITLLHPEKNNKMKSIIWTTKLDKVKTINDVILDEIVSIEPVNPVNHPKMYDLTIPKTLNFGLANGLQVRDTSQTGYIQRRLIKGMEDIKVEYDMTVRNSKNRIVQFSYGEDGIDTVKIEHSNMNFIAMTPDEIYAHFYVPVGGDSETTSELKAVFSKTAFSRMKKQQKLCDEKSKKYTEYLMNVREDIVVKVFKNKNTTDAYLPLSFSHIVANIGGMQKINKNSEVDITPLETFILLEETYARFEQLQYAPPTELFKIMYYYSLTPRDLLMVKRFNRKAVVALAEMMVLMYKRAIVAPGEMVGMIAAQSIGEPTTQLTLNSVAYDSELLLRIDGAIRVVKIGEYIDNYIPKARKSEEHPNDTKLLYVNDDEEVYVPSVDEDGNTSWKRVEALTRHPVVNLDGTNTVLRVTTKDGRSVIATKAKSFLTIDDNNKLVATNGSELKVGDYIPVNIRAFEMPDVREFDVSSILKKTEYAFGSEMHKALSYSSENFWWSKHAKTDFTVPYNRSDTFMEAMKTEPHVDKKTGNVASARQTFLPGIVYPKKRFIGGGNIPEHIPLDFDFGYLIGAYCAEGCTTRTQISIANNCREFFAPIERLMEKWNITTKFYIHNDKNSVGWTSSDLRIYSIVLTDILDILCGKGSPNKCVNYLMFNSNKEFMKGLISAYFAGDGGISKKSNGITAYSVSRTLLENIQSILCYWFGIYTKIKTNKLQLSNNRGSKNILQGYTLSIKSDGSKIFANEITMLIPHKQERLNELKMQPSDISSELKDIIPKYKHNKNIYNDINRKTLVKLCNIDYPYKDVRFDEIVTIEEIPNPTEWVYDLTVESTRTFALLNGNFQFDTFHLSGDASKSQVTRGLPRIEELLSLSENTKNPSTTIYLKPSDESNKDAAADLIPTIELTRLEDIVKSVEICFDPSDLPSETKIAADSGFLAQYAEFQKMLKDVGGEDETECERERSKWILRMEMDRESMYEKRVTMDDVHFAIKAVYSKNDKSEVSCIYSDYNSDNLVFRIRLDFQKKDKEPNTLDQTDKIYQLKTFQDALMKNIILRGIKGVRNVLARKVVDMVAKENNTFRKKETWVLDTTGSNFMEILSLKNIDSRRTISNDIQEINRVLGIEAARQALFNELYEAFDTTYINHHHISLLCDRMTSSSNLISIFRHGINNDDIGPIAKASFEETPEMFLKAARHAELDHVRGISANVMCGQEGFYGTNAFKVMLDIKQIMKMGQVATADKTVEEEKEATIQGFMDKIAAEDPLNPCSKNKLTIQSTLDKIQGSNLGSVDPDYDMGF
jgi:DNA-directed RNA polymerase beta' subunit